VFFIFLCIAHAEAQEYINLKKIAITLTDTVILDSVSIVEGSVILYDENNTLIPDTCYRLNLSAATLIPDPYLVGTKASVVYRSFTFSFVKPYSHKKRENFLSSSLLNGGDANIFTYMPETDGFFNSTELNRKGSIARGISFGNNQDAILNSNLNLQLSGKLSDDIEILAAISDNNIPIQPDGNSQQLQEFDKVFITVFSSRFCLTAGDFEEKKPEGYFLNYNKKVQGIKFSLIDFNILPGTTMTSSLGGSVAKGKYQRQTIQQIEGIQGPYKLKGVNNETYIIILAGTEKIYINGELLLRGQENDYTIDYNTGEFTFTAKRPVTKDTRIIAEFEYSERSYTRFLITSNHNLKTEKGDFWLNLYSEQDNKNQPYDQNLSYSEKMLLSEIGDNLSEAVVLNVDSLGYSNSEIRYSLTDTIVGAVQYDSVFVYSTDAAVAVYRLGFSYVGESNGNYVKSISAANGRVFGWVAPVDGVKQGDYEPVILLVTPKKKQAFNLGGKYRLSSSTMLNAETAITVNDLNTFSDYGKSDDFGYAAKFEINQRLFSSSSDSLILNARYQIADRNFDAIENYRAPEFTRDWNLSELNPSTFEQMAGVDLIYRNKNASHAAYSFDLLNRTNSFTGYNNKAYAGIDLKSWKVNAEAAYLKTSDALYSTSFLRQKAGITKNFKFFKIGVAEEQEYNAWRQQEGDSLAGNSFSWFQYKAFFQTPDTSGNSFLLSYRNRTDALPNSGIFTRSTRSQDFDMGLKLMKTYGQSLNITGNYRILDIYNGSLSGMEPQNNLTGRIEYVFKLWKGFLTSSSFYEIGSALERKTEFSYLEVAAGQGVYMWTDYNGNGVQELDEFELAYFQDQANFIRYFSTTSEYIKTYTNQCSQMLNIRPAQKWKNMKGFAGFLMRFSNQVAYKISSKNTSERISEYANPFAGNVSDSSLVSLNSTVRNEFSFNKGNPKFGFDYIYLNNQNKILLVNGFDSRIHLRHELLVRFSLLNSIQLNNLATYGDKKYDSQYFSGKNYNIKFFENTASIYYQPSIQNRIELKYKVRQKNNISGEESLTSHDVGIEYRLSSVKRGALSFNINYILILFNGSTNGSVAYEMMEGLLPGNNVTWQLSFQHQLANGLQMNLSYNGRAAEDAKTVHTGGIQLRAFF